MTRVAVDTVRAGVPAPDLVQAVAPALSADPDLRLLLVGPVAALRAQLDGSGAAVPEGRIELVGADRAVGPDDDPVVAVRGRRDASVRVAVGLVAAGQADAVVSLGPPAATIVAARFALRRTPGLRVPGLAVDIAIDGHPLTVVDAGVEADASAATLVRYGELSSALASRRGVPAPRIATLAPLGTGSRTLRELLDLFAAADLGAGRFVGALGVPEALAGEVDVLVTAGAAGAIIVDTVRALRPGGPAHAFVLGFEGTVATLGSAGSVGPEALATAFRDVAAVARQAPAGAP